MVSYSILSFNFGGYDIMRTPTRKDQEAEYVYVTDNPRPDTVWNTRTDSSLDEMDPVTAAFYVRYHPFRYVSSDIAVVLDASIQINGALSDIVAEFTGSGADYAPMCTPVTNSRAKLEQSLSTLHRIDEGEALRMLDYIGDSADECGSVGTAFFIVRRCMEGFLDRVWEELLAAGGGRAARVDEVILHRALRELQWSHGMFPLAIQVIQSSYMTYCHHGELTEWRKIPCPDERCYICGKHVEPHRFDKAGIYPRAYRCRTEAMLLTKYLSPSDLAEWLDWHLYRVGFDRVHVFDNESDYDVAGICAKYGNRVSYELVEGHPRQYLLYETYVNVRSAAEWIMPIDDDEFLDIGSFPDVYSAVSYYRERIPGLGMLAIRWKHLFPEDPSAERTGKVLDYCTVEDSGRAGALFGLGDRGVKAIIRRRGPVHYEETWENPSGGHVPKNSCAAAAYMFDGTEIRGCGIAKIPGDLSGEKLRLLHCKYRGPADWDRKYGSGEMYTVSDAVPRKKRAIFI